MPPLGISSVQETVSWCCIAECYLKTNLSTFINIPKILCLALMAGSENTLVMMTHKLLGGILPETQLGGAKEKKYDISGIQEDI